MPKAINKDIENDNENDLFDGLEWPVINSNVDNT
jgi:hypothetical protein